MGVIIPNEGNKLKVLLYGIERNPKPWTLPPETLKKTHRTLGV